MKILPHSTVLLTRDTQNNKKTAKVLKAKGARVLSLPTFKYVEAKTTQKIKRELERISTFDWVVFTSERAVTFFFKKYSRQYKDNRALQKLKIAAIGPVTAKTVKKFGHRVHLIPAETTSAGLARERIFAKTKGLKIFFPQASDAQQEFASVHFRRHWITQSVFYKKTVPAVSPALVKKIKTAKIDWVLFYSPSAVQGFFSMMGAREGKQLLKRSRIAVMGPTTACAVKNYGCGISLKKISKNPF